MSAILDLLETAKADVETIQAALRHRQQPQDVTFHRCLKALRDAIDMTDGTAPAKESSAEVRPERAPLYSRNGGDER